MWPTKDTKGEGGYRVWGLGSGGRRRREATNSQELMTENQNQRIAAESQMRSATADLRRGVRRELVSGG